MPYITEEVWQQIPQPSGTPQSIMITLYPMADSTMVDEEAEASMALVQETIVAVRNVRAEYNISPAVVLTVTIIAEHELARARIDAQRGPILQMARLSELQVFAAGQPPAGTAACVIAGGIIVCVSVAGQIDKTAELQRIAKELTKLERDRAQVAGKLGNASFLARAPREIVEKEQQRLAENEERIAKLESSRQRLQRL